MLFLLPLLIISLDPLFNLFISDGSSDKPLFNEFKNSSDYNIFIKNKNQTLINHKFKITKII